MAGKASPAEAIVPVGQVHEFLGLRPSRLPRHMGVRLRCLNVAGGVPAPNRGRYIHRDDLLAWLAINIDGTGSDLLARLRDELAEVTAPPDNPPT